MPLRRHVQAIAALPFITVVVIPAWIAWRNKTTLQLGHGFAPLLVQIQGATLLGCGLVLFLKSVTRFDKVGQGTLAPWDPPRQLVVSGVYRYVRNPMISGVLLLILGEALVLLSRPHLMWALLFFVINAINIPLLEEPLLLGRFGENYREYCRQVPRLLPRVKPWSP